jgi:hypothetical protein
MIFVTQTVATYPYVSRCLYRRYKVADLINDIYRDSRQSTKCVEHRIISKGIVVLLKARPLPPCHTQASTVAGEC